MNIIVDFLIDYAGGPIPYLAIFIILLACGLGLPIPEDITLFAAGVLAYYGICGVWTLIGVGLFGVLIGDSLVFWLGHRFGRRLLKRWPFRTFIDETRIERVKIRLHKNGGKLLFVARFMPGFRATIFFASGVLHFPYKKLLLYDGAAALISVPAIIYSVYHFGDFLEYVIKMIKKVEGGILGLILVAIILVALKYHLTKKKQSENEL